ncbi:C26 family cysteine hydrolase domain-containing family [archaeon]|jgi:GMP synthase (glutamine-hydrolysing)|nr:C26 family cysteine hydrolase domain-containing family [archaeon]MBT6182668.1 C26 family cysteine hydrolase domain-containing family [archaeon]MBT6606599.1 C26 family cysteine hydrolase domain-containing family [archaeon]MBT7251842.1 C26 family cysteine hydrolase domain-containing family [archaeon]MBT7661112.1 C26 family cysteine hydrolase domain-containing family [archaeon]
MKKKILIINNGSKFSSWLKEELKLQKIPFRVISPTEKINFKQLKNISGVILTGGPKKPSTRNLTNDYKAIEELDVPILGICLGHQTIATHFGAKIILLPKLQNTAEKVKITKSKEPIFKGIKSNAYLREFHKYAIEKLPKDFILLAKSKATKIEAMKHKTKKIYSFQGHPEVSGLDGQLILRNFLKMCGIKYILELKK